MTDLAALPLSLTLPLCLLGGFGLGYAYFRALRGTAALIAVQGRPLFAMGLTLGRMALLGAGFYLAVLAGGTALLAAFAGLLGARALVLRQSGKEAT